MESCLCLNKSNQTPKSQIQIIVMDIENKNKCSSFSFSFLVKWNKWSKAYIPINKLNKIQSQHKLQDHKFKVNNHSNTFPHMAQKLNFNQCPIQPNTKISHLCANSVKSRIRNIRNKTTIKKSNTEKERERERERENRRSSPSTTFVIDQNVKRLLWVVVLSDEGWSDFLMRELGIFKL